MYIHCAWQVDVDEAKTAKDGTADRERSDADEGEDAEGAGGENDQAEKPRRKRRKKYDWDQASYATREEAQKKFAQEVRQKC